MQKYKNKTKKLNHNLSSVDIFGTVSYGLL